MSVSFARSLMIVAFSTGRQFRVRTAMAAQTLLDGRYLGGRPPYGHTFRDLGPHPNPAKTADGKHLKGLTPADQTAPIVRQIFAEFPSSRRPDPQAGARCTAAPDCQRSGLADSTTNAQQSVDVGS
ncbi:hypothetical protein ACQPWW_22520 [Micromonospora sp. CA-240977]|uniref:hypothetical protein n=1 Tax=Micromonospora sp. CA-240977 TaxID=3239957 RepID=UPI003D8E3CB9